VAKKTSRVRKQRVSTVFKLGRTQAGLDFVDVDIKTDTRLFLSPKALELLPSQWGEECVSLIQSFFSTVLKHIKAGRHSEAEALLGTLKEPNETHLGLSKAKSQGRALGTESAKEVWAALSRSLAAKSGLLRDLEDTVLLIEGVGVDIISDITTNIIRQPLIHYTQEMARQVGIPLTSDIDSGPMWDPAALSWFSEFVELPMTKEGKLLLVPKAVVRPSLLYKADRYFRHFILGHLRQVELDANSALVTVLKNKKRKVYKKDLISKYGKGKKAVVEQTLKHPEVLNEYRKEVAAQPYNPLTLDQIGEIENLPPPDWDKLLNDLISLPTGAKHATAYERASEALMTALFYPDLVTPFMQYPLHSGRKRVDIRYTNMALAGFFQWLAAHHPASNIWIECKNYRDDIANNELDQLAGRFSPSRGQVGLLVSRRFDKKQLFYNRCRDTAQDGRGYILALDDDDLKGLVDYRKTEKFYQAWDPLKQLFDALVS
jgi:hypothetical protein